MFAWSFCPHRTALAATSRLYDGVDDALHRLVRVSNQRGRDLEALGRLAGLVDKLEKVCEGWTKICCFMPLSQTWQLPSLASLASHEPMKPE